MEIDDDVMLYVIYGDACGNVVAPEQYIGAFLVINDYALFDLYLFIVGKGSGEFAVNKGRIGG